MEKYTYKYGQHVEFNLPLGLQVFSGTGVVKGVSVTGMPVVGVTYIIYPSTFTGDIVTPSDEYPFKEFCLSEVFLKPMPLIDK